MDSTLPAVLRHHVTWFLFSLTARGAASIEVRQEAIIVIDQLASTVNQIGTEIGRRCL